MQWVVGYGGAGCWVKCRQSERCLGGDSRASFNWNEDRGVDFFKTSHLIQGKKADYDFL